MFSATTTEPWLGNRLQAGCKVRRLTYDGLLLRRPPTDLIANDHEPGRDADTHLQW